jgi:secreted PhoX family phosphatase
MTDFLPANGYSDGDVDTNRTSNPTLESLVGERYSRRQAMFGGIGALTIATLGTPLLAGCGGSGGAGADNIAPVVSAGANATSSSGRVVKLLGMATDDRGVAFTGWTQISGPPVTLSNPASSSATFLAPSVASSTELKFRFSATDAKGLATTAESTITIQPAMLGFTSVEKNRNDQVTVPADYIVTVMTRLGDPIAAGVAAYANNGTDTNFAARIGDHGDALYWYGLSASGGRDDNSSVRGLMVQNHENLNEQYLHPTGPTNLTTGPRPEAEAIKEIEAHGVSVTEYRDSGNRSWGYVQDSSFNHRITPNTPVMFTGPVRGTNWLKTAYSPDGTSGRGTINNCANGHTLWGTNLTCEENWAGYFRRDNSGAGTDNGARTPRELTALRRYGVNSNIGNFAWSTVSSTNTVFARWDARAKGASATADFRNEPNQMGWAIELDPYDKTQAPRKRTSLGRFAHEGAWFGRFVPGKKLAVYLGDDSRREYFYKFVSNASWDPADANAGNRLAVGDKYLDAGTLYVAKFNADGTGTWIPLVFGQVPDRPAIGTDPAYVFADQADILVNTRLAGDAVGATPMDRPEWTATNNLTGEIYLTLTNNNAALRPLTGTDAANPRHYNDPKGTANQFGNPNGHILRLRETGDDAAATSFSWDIYLFGADSAQASPANVNLSGLDATNDFSSPDGLWFARPQNASGQVKPVLWIQTDDGAFTDVTNNQMLAAMPGSVGDGGFRTITNIGASGTATQTTRVGAAATAATLKRFLVGPIDCEITGVDTTPDGRTLFVGIQHPGETGSTAAPTSHWPDSQATGSAGATVRPRSAIVAITKSDGGVVAL